MTSTDKAEKSEGAAGILLTLREAPLAVKALLGGVFVNKLGQFVQIFLVLFMTKHGFTNFQAGTALSVYGVGGFAGVLIGGTLAERLGARGATVLSMTGTAALVLGVLYVRNYPALLVIVLLVSAVGTLYRPASAALLSELSPPERKLMVFALYRLALNLGTTAAPLIGVALIKVSYGLLFWGEALTALAYAAIAMVALPPRVRPQPTDSAEPDAAEAGPGGGYLAVLADWRFALFLLALFVNSVVYIQYVAVLPLAVPAAGEKISLYGALVALNGLIVITCELLMTKLTQNLPSRTVAMTGFALLGVGMALYAVPLGAAMFVIGTLVWSLAEIVAGPTMFAYPAMTGPERLRPRYIASGQVVFNLGIAVGPAVGVAIWNSIGRSVWLVCGLACLAGFAASWVGVRATSATGQAQSDTSNAPEASDAGPAAAPA